MVMCPLTVELRQGWTGVWQVRADYTHDQWQDTKLSNIRPEDEVRLLIAMDSPGYKMVRVWVTGFDA